MQYNKKSVEDIDVNGKKVIVRCDFNVPQDENGNITDDKRIRASSRRSSTCWTTTRLLSFARTSAVRRARSI